MKTTLLLATLVGLPTFAQESTPTEPNERIDAIEGKVTSIDEQLAEAKATLAGLTKIKLSGYIQARYQYAENSKQGIDSSANPLVKDGFSVRRGRLKATYLPSQYMSFVLQLDAVPSAVSLKDAEAHLTEPWTGQRLQLTVGQTKWPFGYEVVQSSGDREFPERTRVVRAFAAGERDRGAKLNAKLGAGRLSLGVFDGNGTEYRVPGGQRLFVDNDKNKDVVGLSGWWGRTMDPGNPTASTAVPSTGTYDRTRLGADVQLYLDLVPLGGTAIKGEFITGRTYFSSGIEQLGVPALGWYLLATQNLGTLVQVAARFDYFDGQAGVGDAVSSSNPAAPASRNGVGTLGLLAAYYFDESIKITAVFEVPLTGTVDTALDPNDNLFTLQFQAKF
jgi:hypothetical protein